jgi:Zn-dependent protease with chaperone function
MKITRLFTVLTLALPFCACGPALRPPSVSPQLLQQEIELQREMTFRTDVERRIKLQRIYTPLRLANADLCGANVSAVTGMVGIDRQSIASELRAIAQRLYGVADGVTIVDVVPGSPADQVGLQARDVITGAAKGAGVMPSGWSFSGLTVQDLVKIILTSEGGSITLLVRRAGSVFPLVLTPGLGCSYPIEPVYDDRFNAFADGNRIVVFTGLFNHVPDDREVAVIVGHELAHNALRHVEKKQGNAAVGGTAGLLLDIGLLALGVNTQGAIARAGMEAGALAYSQEFESEADYLGLYMLARAGFDIDVAPDLYRRRAVQKPSTQMKTYYSTHPSTPERAAAMTQTIAEINNKRLTQTALLPSTLPGQTLEVKALPTLSHSTVVTAQTHLPTATPNSGATTSVAAFAPIAPQSQIFSLRCRCHLSETAAVKCWRSYF